VCFLEACVGEVNDDDPRRRVQLRGHHDGEPDRSGADDHDRVAGVDLAVQDADLVGGREDVGEEQHLLVAQRLGDLVHRCVGERDARVLRLQSVDQVAEDPAAARALPIASASLRPSENISSGVQIVSASVARPGISAGAIPAPVARTRKS
jgi:hypothetical protein